MSLKFSLVLRKQHCKYFVYNNQRFYSSIDNEDKNKVKDLLTKLVPDKNPTKQRDFSNKETRNMNFDKMINLLKETQKKQSDLDNPINKKVSRNVRDHLDVDPVVRKSAFDVAKILGEKKNVEKISSDLLEKFKNHSIETTSKMSELLSQMEVKKENKQRIGRKMFNFEITYSEFNFNKEERLNIFNFEEPKNPSNILNTYTNCEHRFLQLLTHKAPKNAIEEQIQMTESGKLWTFPIDNEIGMEEEKKYSFVDHIFLEKHLNGWCPKSGPIRHFMHLVCAGLSSNPHINVKRKIDHIEWYKKYFGLKNKLDLLEDSGVPSHLLPTENTSDINIPRKDFYIKATYVSKNKK